MTYNADLASRLSSPVSGIEYQQEATPERWYVVYTAARHEKYVSRQLQERCIENFLPTYCSIRHWKDRRKELDLPLFPGYVFVRLSNACRLRVLTTPGVVRFVGSGRGLLPLNDEEIECLKLGMASGICIVPHPYLKVGTRVRVRRGPLAGTHGFLVRKKDKFRVVLSIHLIMRSIAAEVEIADLE